MTDGPEHLADMPLSLCTLSSFRGFFEPLNVLSWFPSKVSESHLYKEENTILLCSSKGLEAYIIKEKGK